MLQTFFNALTTKTAQLMEPFSSRSNSQQAASIAPADPCNLRILIVAEHASMRFGGEATLPLHYFRILRQRGIEAWLVVHERTRDELMDSFAEDSDRIYFTPDTAVHRALYSTSQYLPRAIFAMTCGFAMQLLTQIYQRRLSREIVKSQRIDLIHQPICVSPRTPSLIYGMGVPVVMGPMNGGMTYPPGFQHMQSRAVRLSVYLGRLLSNVLNALIPGKRLADILLVANQRTRNALPTGIQGQVIELVENGVDISLWKPKLFNPSMLKSPTPESAVTRFVFMGRLVDWKGVDLLLRALKKVLEQTPAKLEIIGEGPDRAALEQLAQELGMMGHTTQDNLKDSEGDRTSDRAAVQFIGWLSQAECAQRLQHADVLVLPSLFECGGAVVLEAMTVGLPVIATSWGGPIDYVNEQSGVLIAPTSQADFIEDLADAMIKLAKSPILRKQMGQAGRQQVLERFDWEKKIDDILQVYAEVTRSFSPANTLCDR
ncbi:MAG: glycosyltransferase family 4 protein [Drouetiella hepatica Uher 2000/2452]|jgi:glycosyltransferase involved in cell wall biosynthesis|uniref:Glycosyltransferase family 4 protein n=1 Tax=Drouetiella hepatica Uher 2000/2452 TaxID=904376 RepID=A0A951Q9X8_9CYAN|nr:glycosyltransferase family 4 protein [Drouetiella hepatica Uher 2000/2452]